MLKKNKARKPPADGSGCQTSAFKACITDYRDKREPLLGTGFLFSQEMA